MKNKQDEKWLPVPIKEFEDRYEVSNFGRVKSKVRLVSTHNGGERKIREKIMKPQKTGSKRGRAQITLFGSGGKTTFSIAKLVAMAHVENPNNYEHVVFYGEDDKYPHAIDLSWSKTDPFKEKKEERIVVPEIEAIHGQILKLKKTHGLTNADLNSLSGQSNLAMKISSNTLRLVDLLNLSQAIGVEYKYFFEALFNFTDQEAYIEEINNLKSKISQLEKTISTLNQSVEDKSMIISLLKKP